MFYALRTLRKTLRSLRLNFTALKQNLYALKFLIWFTINLQKKLLWLICLFLGAIPAFHYKSSHPKLFFYAPKGASVGRSFRSRKIGFWRSGLSITIGARAVGTPKHFGGIVSWKETTFSDFCKGFVLYLGRHSDANFRLFTWLSVCSWKFVSYILFVI